MVSKVCKQCRTEKDVASFGRDARNRDGRVGCCKACDNARLKEWRQANADGKYLAHLEKSRVRARAYYESNRDDVLAKDRAKRATPAGKAKRAAQDLAYRRANVDAQRVKQKAYAAANREAIRAYKRRLAKLPHIAAVKAATVAWRRARLVNATPAWVDRSALRAPYGEAKSLTQTTGDKHHVDHIVPLVSPIVCGLHVPWNLQVLPYIDNHRKSNKHWPDMPGD